MVVLYYTHVWFKRLAVDGVFVLYKRGSSAYSHMSAVVLYYTRVVQALSYQRWFLYYTRVVQALSYQRWFYTLHVWFKCLAANGGFIL